MSAGDATNVVRALIGAITPKEHDLEAELTKLKKERDDQARGIERRRWLIENALKKLLKEIEIEDQTVPEGDLLGPFLRSAASSRVAKVAVVDAKGEMASVPDIEALADEAQKEVEQLTNEITSNEGKASTAAAVAKQIESESPGLSATIDEAEAPRCPVCEVPSDRVLAEGCEPSHKLPNLASLHERRAKLRRTSERRRSRSKRRRRPSSGFAESSRRRRRSATRRARTSPLLGSSATIAPRLGMR